MKNSGQDCQIDEAYQLLAHANLQIGNRFDDHELTAISKPGFKGEVYDNPSIYLLPGTEAGNDAVLFISQKAFPEFVADAVARAKRARQKLSAACASVVLEPIVAGYFNGKSYAIWARQRPISDSRLARIFQKIRLSPRVFKWLRLVAEETRSRINDSVAVAEHIRQPLEFIEANEKLSDGCRTIASRGLSALEDQTWSPVSILQHSDFWLGNVLLPRKTARSADSEFGFYVIDWGGALDNGAPGFDLVRYCISTNWPLPLARSEFSRYLRTVGASPRELRYYLLVALGRIGADRGQFPEERYIEMCERCIDYLDSLELDSRARD